ncbi:ketopantoate reductase family protein [Mucilaginibacter aquaedulcis]|uniref:ketopantoate reductase family protein n=1 Tax=Mucilaginibacter aquaedulcis TaxID=1187081 RepID=UPI0025B590DC|nr:ketopantoate reductase family protein [Mucilaginibacter aquaedulcis]MDN3547256.1 ketopantoate reductase family protein [Mucilaginibacter aquaedulcis]
MNNGQIATTYILGLGALGSLYAAHLYDMNPASVRIIADADRIARFNKEGITINDKRYDFTYVSLGDEVQAPADLIIIAVKAHQLARAIDDIKPFVNQDTTVISLLNGISSEEIIGAEIGMEHLLYAYGVGMDAVRTGNSVNYQFPGWIYFGEKNNEVYSERVAAIKTLFEKAAIPFKIPVDMQRALWAKFMMNTGINQVSAVLKAPYGVFQLNKGARQLMVTAANEVLTIGKKAGIGIDQTDMDAFLHIVDGLNPAGKTSMLQDIEAGRQSELDIFAGKVIALGKTFNIPTPVNEVLFSVIRAMEAMGPVN